MNETKGYTDTISTADFEETPRLILEQPTGDVRVEAWDRPEIQVSISDPEGLFELQREGSKVLVHNRPGSFKLVNFLEPAREELEEFGVDLGKVAARVERSVERSMRRMARKGLNLNIDVSNWRGGRDYTIKVPHECDLTLRTSSGDISVGGVAGTLLIQTTSGDMKLKGVEGNLLLTTASGDILIDGMDGKLGLRTASGDIRSRGLNLQEVSAASASGDLELEIENLPTRNFELRTVSGDINLFVPHDAQLKAEVHTISGSLNCGFPRSQVEYRATHKRETLLNLNGGGVHAQLHTVSGDVYIRPRKNQDSRERGGANTMDLTRAESYSSQSESDRENHGDIVRPEGYVNRQQAELEILQQVERGELTPQQALDRLSRLDGE
jgi:DUF4097 and DUF4098 domain-containing protein YvlB